MNRYKASRAVPGFTHPADDVVMVRQVGFAVLAAVYLVAIEIGVVREAHDCDDDFEFECPDLIQSFGLTTVCAWTRPRCKKSGCQDDGRVSRMAGSRVLGRLRRI